MDRLIVKTLPADVRARYGAEIEDLLRSSKRPLRDRADVLFAALGLRLGSMTMRLLVASGVGVAAFAAALLYATAQLRDGLVETPGHWWSAFLLAGFLASVTAVSVLVVAQHRAKAWRRT